MNLFSKIMTLAAGMLICVPSATSAAPGAASQRRGLVDLSVACVRTAPAHASELSTQALCGTPLLIDSVAGEWLRVTLPDGYTGYINSSSVTELDSASFEAWRNAPRIIVTAPGTTIAVSDTLSPGSPRRVVADLVAGCIVVGERQPGSGYVNVTFPDGRSGYLPSSAVAPLREWARRSVYPQLILDTAYGMTGTPYLWGGTSSKGPDCSGLVKCAWMACGVIVPRDASQQALVGTEVDLDDPGQWQPADLLFFTNEAGRVVHVAIYDRDGGFVHSSGRVKHGHISPSHPDFDNRLPAIVRRFVGCENTPGIVRLLSHPWYFDQK